MKKVIDVGALRSPKLETFLAAARTNVAVITDYAAMECFKGDGNVNVRNSLSIVSRFPDQVLVLRPTSEIARLRPRSKGLHSRFVDERQNRGFRNYCKVVLSGHGDPRAVAFDIYVKEVHARRHFEKLATNVSVVRNGIAKLASSYPPEGLKALRARRPISQSFADRLIDDILTITAIFFRDQDGLGEMPVLADAIFSLPFRYALCSYALTVKWISDGGHSTAAAPKLSNDFTDMTYAAYATFFDGLITNDAKLNEIYHTASWMLREVFSVTRVV